MSKDAVATEIAEIHGKIADCAPSEFLSPIWKSNISNSIREIIYSDIPYREMLRKIHLHVHYSLQNNLDVIKPQMEWWLYYFEHNGIVWNEFEESDFVEDEFCGEIDGKRFSPDFARRIAHNDVIDKNVQLDGDRRITVMELGGGYGGFARLFKLKHPDTSYIMIDIPDTLVIAYGFLRSVFPDLNILVVTEEEQALDESLIVEYDFILIPVGLDHKVHGLNVDLFVNTHSLGEMPNKAVSHWMDLIQKRINVKNVFMLNRYLNRLNPREQYRMHENTASCLYDEQWNVKKWEFEPGFMKCPFNETIENQCLLLVLSRDNEAPISKFECAEAASKHLEFVKQQDWFKFASTYEPMTRVRDIMSPFFGPERVQDFTVNGTLFHLWEAIRLNPSKSAIGTMISYLKYINVNAQPFEELVYYINLFQRVNN